jgi:hypothetical protein
VSRARRAGMLAHLVATPVLERLGPRPRYARVGGVLRTAAYVEADSFVIALTARGVPLMPNGVALTERPHAGAWPPPRTGVRMAAGRIEAGRWAVTWPADEPPAWDPTVAGAGDAAPHRLRDRGAAILAARGIAPELPPPAMAAAFARGGVETASDPAARNGIALLLRSLEGRDPEVARRAVDLLIGRGPGLTPEGDDLVAGAAAAVAALGDAAGWSAGAREQWLAAVRPATLRRLTTPLSATLLELAAGGQVVEPVHGLLDLRGGERWAGALDRLLSIGHSTGPAYAAAVGATAVLLGRRAAVASRR